MKLTSAAFFLLVALIFERHSCIKGAKLNASSIAASLSKLDDCFKDTVISFADQQIGIPLNEEQLSDMCKRNYQGLQCLRSKLQNEDPLIKRMVKSYSQARQKFLKKYCNNINSDTSKTLIQAMKCAWDKSRKEYTDADIDYIVSMQAIEKKRFDDSKLELQYVCCTILKYADSYENLTKPKCAQYQRIWKEIVESFTSHELGLLCPADDDNFLKETCSNLPKLARAAPDLSKLPAGLTIYLVMTLGEP